MIYIVTGKRNVGKTRALKELLKMRSNCDGVLSVKVFEQDVFKGYGLERVNKGWQYPFMIWDRNQEIEGRQERIGDFVLLETGILKGQEIINHSISSDKDTVIDEVGQLELRGKVFYKQVKRAVDLQRGDVGWDLYLVVRIQLLKQVIEYFEVDTYELIRVEEKELTECE